MLKNPRSQPYSCTGLPRDPAEPVIYSSRLYSRAMNKVGVVRPSGGATVRGSRGIPEDRRGKRRPQMRPVSQTTRSPMAAGHEKGLSAAY